MEWACWTVGGQLALPPLHRSLDTQAGILFSPLVGTRRRGKEPLVLFGLQFDSDISDLTSGMPALPALWQLRLPCGRVVVEHEMCGYCGPISLKILLSRPPETEGAIRK